MKRIFTLIIAFLMIASSTLYAEWEDCNDGLEYGRINQIAASNNDLFIVGLNGLYKSSNYGKNWVNQKLEEDINPLKKIAISENNICVLSEDGYLYWSINAGQNWKKTSGSSNTINYDPVFYLNKNKLYLAEGQNLRVFSITADSVATTEYITFNSFIKDIIRIDSLLFISIKDYGILKTSNLIDFEIVNNGILDSNINKIKFVNNTIYVASENSGVYYSTDLGKTWQTNNTSTFPKSITDLVINENQILVHTENDFDYKSDDLGKTWLKLDGRKSGPSGNFVYLNSILFSNSNGSGVFLSTNFGSNWKASNNGLDNPFGNIKKYSDILYTYEDKQLFQSNDNGKNWSLIYRNFDSKIKNIVVKNSNIYICEKNQKILYSEDNGTTWKNLKLKENVKIQFCYLTESEIFIITDQGIFVSKDMANTWELYSNSFTNSYTSNFVKNGKFACLQNSDSLFFTVDNGKNWSLFEDKNFIINILQNLLNFEDFVYFKANYLTHYFSNNNGENWIDLNDKVNNVSDFKIFNKSNLFCQSKNGLFISNDQGLSWQSINNGIDSTNILSFNIFELSSNSCYLICQVQNKGFYFSTNFGKSWSKLENLASLDNILNYKIIANDLFVIESNYGIRKASLSELGISSDINQEPVSSSNNSEYTIYPNPCSDNLNIHFTNSVNPNSKIELFDILGNQVFQSQITSFDQETKINLESLQAGVYLLKIADKVDRIVVR